jgi:hypothetical protein
MLEDEPAENNQEENEQEYEDNEKISSNGPAVFSQTVPGES